MVTPSVGEIVKIRHTEPHGFKYTFHVIVMELPGGTEFIGRVESIFADGADEGELMCGNDICRRFKGQQETFQNSDIVQ